jgi:hypothetical protein
VTARAEAVPSSIVEIARLTDRRRVVLHDGGWVLQRYIDRVWLSCSSYSRREALIRAVHVECGQITPEAAKILSALPPYIGEW